MLQQIQYEYQKKPTVTSFNETTILHYFFRQIELNVVKDHKVFLVNELMKDILEISEEHGQEEPLAALRHSKRLKEKLLDQFREKIQLTKTGNKNVLHCSDVSSLASTETTLKGHALRDA